MQLAPVLDREEYVEQAYFFRTFRERLKENIASQEILGRIHEEILATTRLPFAIQFLATELKHTGLLAMGLEKLPHYFTPFQAFVIHQAEEEGRRFGMGGALQTLEAEAHYRSEQPSRPGLYVFQFEVLSRHRLGYDGGLRAMAQDGYYDEPWREYMETVRKSVGEVDFADLVYLRSELYVKDQLRLKPEQTFPPVLFGEKEGKIAKANRGRDPLYLFAALQRQLGYPQVPRSSLKEKDNPEAKLQAVEIKMRELEARLQIIENEARGKLDFSKLVGKVEDLDGDG